jgi:membrane-associated protein
VATVDHLAALLTDVVVHTGRFAPAVLFGATFVEYVFPPFPGDTIVVLGAWIAMGLGAALLVLHAVLQRRKVAG